ncbi:glycoside hydrolase family 3 protein, partial [Patescibacteria group bacterium]|nr:glycoside hydrolase family 3 protein [Patescibacteria group bacterium]
LALAKTIKEIQPGGVLLLRRNIVDEVQVRKLINDLQRISIQNTGYPLFIAVDQEGVPINRVTWGLPKTAQSELEDFQDAYNIGRERAQMLAGLGFNMNLAPVLDSNASSQDFIYSCSLQKAYGEAEQVVKGLIWGHESEGVVVVPKHFPGYDGIAYNPEKGDIPAVSDLPNIGLFEGVFESTSQRFVMLSHVIYEEVDSVRPFPFSKEGIDFLKQELSKEVIIMTDDLASPSLTATYDIAEIGARAITGGVDILLVAGHRDTAAIDEFYKGFVKLVEGDKQLRALVAVASQKILQAKQDFLP